VLRNGAKQLQLTMIAGTNGGSLNNWLIGLKHILGLAW